MSTPSILKAGPAEVTDANFSQEVLHSFEPVLLDCWAPWCGPCRLMGPVIDELAIELAGSVKVAKLNVDQNPQTAQALGIQSIPTLLMFREGKVIGGMTGAAPKPTIRKMLLQRLQEA
jgi:thioredoxin